MRRALGLVLFLSVSSIGCETAPLGARCENRYDCDRSGSATPVAVCVQFEGTQMCMGSGSPNCICCPTNEAERRMIPGCTPRIMPTPDTATFDAVDTGGNDTTPGDAQPGDATVTDVADTGVIDIGPGDAATMDATDVAHDAATDVASDTTTDAATE